jgi:hypothetical protein
MPETTANPPQFKPPGIQKGKPMTPVIPSESPPQAAFKPLPAEDAGTVQLPPPGHGAAQHGHPALWLYTAGAGLSVLAAAAAAVSFTAQYRLVYAARRLTAAAVLEAAIPDAAALVFACLGVALALHGRRALRARTLNAASAGASVFMNVIAAAPGWRDLAVWAMPPAAYALASDTLIGVVRTSVLARHPAPGGLAGEVTLLAVLGGVGLWLLRLTLAPVSTLTGFRAWVIEECPVAPGRRAVRTAPAIPQAAPAIPQAVPVVPAGTPAKAAAGRPSSGAHPAGSPSPQSRRPGTKTARFLSLVTEQHGPLAGIPLGSVGRISAQAAPQAGLHPGTARAALRRAVLTAQNGDPR